MLARTLWAIVSKLAQSVRIEIFLYIKTYLDRFERGGCIAMQVLGDGDLYKLSNLEINESDRGLSLYP
ncbi:hypothetical protein [Chamaesiphon sp. OTE_8_metabat_110]|uniref:hypothetical protein n=1 Tax=Chamaesiphon sp. OTE_8_metabat_110 TaxID=2964696 RepID=UPI00286B8DDC|nr:hypothetical protein [Chamaesiphon sp. OTE_8_metabat_110]